MATGPVFEGTWEEVSRMADRFAGKQVRLVIVQDKEGERSEAGLPFYATATPQERARAWEQWCALPRPQVPPLSEEAVSRESIYSPDQD